jgi:hypothetical protein
MSHDDASAERAIPGGRVERARVRGVVLVGAVASNVATMVVGEVGLHFGGSVRRSGIDLGDGGVSADGVSHDAVSWPVSVKTQTVKPRKDVSC